MDFYFTLSTAASTASKPEEIVIINQEDGTGGGNARVRAVEALEVRLELFQGVVRNMTEGSLLTTCVHDMNLDLGTNRQMEPKENYNAGDIAFNGTDGLTCHQFIRAIRKQGLEVDRQTDNRWMADYASIRFNDNALRWFESLDDETQTDWRRLRRVILTRYSDDISEDIVGKPPNLEMALSLPVFKGESEAECQHFVRQIRIRAFAQGREGDSAWMARLAYPCFDAEALKWHTSLPKDIRAHWTRLKKAILLDYPRVLLSEISPARIRVNKWFSPVPPSPLLQSIRSHTDWLNHARANQKRYTEAKNPSAPCWLLVQSEKEIPENAIRTGTNVEGKPFYSARVWYEDAGLVVGKCGRHFHGTIFALKGKEIYGITPFKVLVGDPSYFHWVAVPSESKDLQAVIHLPFVAVEAGFETAHKDICTLVSQVELSDSSWHPGKVHSGSPVTQTSYYGKEVTRSSIRVLAWVE
ncbi:hypothetical protein FRC04_000689 [Tulasnella sp. 424]|nr:hypothetical protein FRC04_000689 [Tulasnella sp. 424]